MICLLLHDSIKISSAVNALSSTSSAFVAASTKQMEVNGNVLDENLKKQALAEEEKAFSDLKVSHQLIIELVF